jgi:hypothetical protein
MVENLDTVQCPKIKIHTVSGVVLPSSSSEMGKMQHLLGWACYIKPISVPAPKSKFQAQLRRYNKDSSKSKMEGLLSTTCVPAILHLLKNPIVDVITNKTTITITIVITNLSHTSSDASAVTISETW